MVCPGVEGTFDCFVIWVGVGFLIKELSESEVEEGRSGWTSEDGWGLDFALVLGCTCPMMRDVHDR